MWTYIAGPFLAVLPKTWRKALLFSDSINWTRACVLSGLAEMAMAVLALMQWYASSMTTWVSRGLEVAMKAGETSGITDHAIGGMALFMWVNHPLTWILGYFSVEGAVRMCGAAFSDTPLGTFPLFLVDKTVRWILFGSKSADESPNAAASFMSAVSDKLLESSVRAGADEISYVENGGEEIMEIQTSRKKPDWDPPRVVRYEEKYYRLEDCSKRPGPRPFRYTLRRLAAGVPGRTVLLYEPGDAVVAGRR